jgi:hypothetical protein
LSYIDKTQFTFALFPKLSTEIKAQIIRHLIDTQPCRLLLRLSPQNGQTGTRFTNLECPIPPILQVNKELRAKGTPLHNYVELKHNAADAQGLICRAEIDMIFISKQASTLTAETFKKSLLASDCLHKVKSIAISVTHPHFWAFIKDFKTYSGLELVFIVVSEEEHPSRLRKWGLTNDQDDLIDCRLSCKKEILFEVLHPSNDRAASDAIPGVMTKNHRRVTYREPEVMEKLVMEMARDKGEGEMAAPDVRFVRLVKCQKTQGELAREYAAFYAR